MTDFTGTTDSDTLAGGIGDDSISGLEGNDNLNGNAGNDTIDGGGGNDFITGGAGDDFLDGGQGFDLAAYNVGATGGIAVNLSAAGPQAVGGGMGSDTLQNIEGLIGSGFADTLTGDGSDNTFLGLGGNDVIDGGGGNDTVVYAFAGGATVNLGIAGPQNTFSEGVDTLINIENVTGSDSGSDRITGNGGDNILSGRGGNDTLDGGGGNDVLDGGAGGFDSASYANAGSGVTVDLGIHVGQAVGAGQGVDTLINIESVIGSAFADTLSADTQATDTTFLQGGAGNDVLNGGPDPYNEGNDDDQFVVASYGAASGAVTVDLNITGPRRSAAARGPTPSSTSPASRAPTASAT